MSDVYFVGFILWQWTILVISTFLSGSAKNWPCFKWPMDPSSNLILRGMISRPRLWKTATIIGCRESFRGSLARQLIADIFQIVHDLCFTEYVYTTRTTYQNESTNVVKVRAAAMCIEIWNEKNERRETLRCNFNHVLSCTVLFKTQTS